MKKSKVVTPVLLFLMIMLLLIAIYYNLAVKPLESKIDAMAMKNELLKNQRMEIELAMKSLDTIEMNIENMKETLSNKEEMKLIDGKMIADDFNSNAKPFLIHLNNIIVGEPQLAEGSIENQKALIFIPASLSFITTYEKGANYIGSFENSQIGAYKINSIEILEEENALLNWNVTLSLYYYGDSSTVPTSDSDNPVRQTLEDSEAKIWTQ